MRGSRSPRRLWTGAGGRCDSMKRETKINQPSPSLSIHPRGSVAFVSLAHWDQAPLFCQRPQPAWRLSCAPPLPCSSRGCEKPRVPFGRQVSPCPPLGACKWRCPRDGTIAYPHEFWLPLFWHRAPVENTNTNSWTRKESTTSIQAVHLCARTPQQK
jgi:hypothetical protein